MMKCYLNINILSIDKQTPRPKKKKKWNEKRFCRIESSNLMAITRCAPPFYGHVDMANKVIVLLGTFGPS